MTHPGRCSRSGEDMADRSWYYASEGQQQGPFPEIQLRDFIARGTVTADTLVWSDGMAGWQQAGEIPGLVSGGSGPPVIPQRAGPPRAGAGGRGDGPLSIDFGIWDVAWRSLVLWLGLLLIIPGPWALVWYLRWFVPSVHVPGRPNLGFTGEVMTIVPWYFGAIVLAVGVGLAGSELLSNLTFLVQIALYWLFLKWFVANLASNGQPLGLGFSGSFWAYLGWTVLGALLHPHDHRLGVGLRGLAAVGLPKYPGHAARSRIRRHRTGVSVACDRGRHRQLLHHPDSMGVSLDVALAGVADSVG
jgi:GYF domain 2